MFSANDSDRAQFLLYRDYWKVLVKAPTKEDNQPPAEKEEGKDKDSLASTEEEQVPVWAFT